MSEPLPKFKQDETRESQEAISALADLDSIRMSLRDDPEFLINFFLAGMIDSEVPEFHKTIFKRMTDMDLIRILLAIPRGHAKTTLAKLAVVWYYCFTSYRFAVYVSNTSTIATNACIDIVNFLKSDNFSAVFGRVNWIMENTSKGIWKFEIEVDGKIKTCILRSAGAGQQMRGINIDNQRPDICVVDDLEDLDNTGNPVLQEKLDNWVFSTLIKAFAKHFKIIWIGNMLTPTALLARLSKDPDWNPIVFGSIVTDPVTREMRPLWPDLWPMEALKKDLQEYKRLGLVETWMCEMMNLPGQGEDGFSQSQINYVSPVQIEDLEGTYMTLDPAFGQDNTIHDDSAIVVHGVPKGDIPRVLEYNAGKGSEADTFYKMLEYARRWNCWVWGIEVGGQQGTLIKLFEMLAAAEDEHNIQFVELHHNNKSKASRISAWVAAMETGIYGIPDWDMDITTQLLAYNKRKDNQKDDLIDSCASGLNMFENNFGLISSQYRQMMNRPEKLAVATYGASLSNI